MWPSNCTPGSAHCQADWAISCHSSRARWVSWTWPVVRSVVCHEPSLTTPCMNESGMRTELLEFWPDTVP